MTENRPETDQPVMVAMSGGVDSSVAAALLCEQGYQVSGIMMRLYEPGMGEDNFETSLSTAREVCGILNIPFQVIDLREEFRKKVIAYFTQSHLLGRTPNPCFVCNRQIKWGLLLDAVIDRGINWLASGHYARVIRNDNGIMELYKAVDDGKDQSYVLSSLNQSILSHVVLPLGNLKKDETREIARRYNFNNSSTKESQDLCFTNGMGQEEYLRIYAPQLFVAGEIRTADGRKVGEHAGLANYTIGQRKGLGAGNREPIYVLQKDTISNTVIVGRRAELGAKNIIVTDVSWVSGQEPPLPDDFEVKIRYRSTPKQGSLYKKDGAVYDIIFSEPVRDPTPGQYAVFYQGAQVFGNSLIIDSLSGVAE